MQHRYIRRIVGPGVFLAVAMLVLLGGCDSAEQDNCPPHIPSCGNPAYFNYPAWHPSGASHTDSVDTDSDGVLDTRFSGIWLVDAETGETAPLLAGYFSAAWRPDGRALAVTQGGQIYTVEVEGAEDIATARADTATIRRLTNDGANFWPAWSPDGQYIVYESDRAVGQIPEAFGHAIYKMRADGSEITDISEHGTGEWRNAHWSPDGERVVHTRYMAGVERQEVVTMDAGGGNPLRLTFDDDTNRRPRYSPDGSRIALQVVGAPASRIHVVNTDGSGLHPIGPEDAYAFDWSPDGSRIVFLWNDISFDPRAGQLWTMQSNGSDARPLTHFTPSTNTP